jgi:hypothetical protein
MVDSLAGSKVPQNLVLLLVQVRRDDQGDRLLPWTNSSTIEDARETCGWSAELSRATVPFDRGGHRRTLLGTLTDGGRGLLVNHENTRTRAVPDVLFRRRARP